MRGGNEGISRKGERLRPTEFLSRVPKFRASKQEKEGGLGGEERGLVLQKKKKKKGPFGSPNVVEKSHGD